MPLRIDQPVDPLRRGHRKVHRHQLGLALQQASLPSCGIFPAGYGNIPRRRDAVTIDVNPRGCGAALYTCILLHSPVDADSGDRVARRLVHTAQSMKIMVP
jgi:hypothetical protein